MEKEKADDPHKQIVQLIKQELLDRGTSVRALSAEISLPPRSLQNILDGKEPRLRRAADICKALGLEFYIGPPRESESLKEAPLLSDITAALDLPAGASGKDILAAIADLAARAGQADADGARWQEVQAKLSLLLQAQQGGGSVTEPAAGYQSVTAVSDDQEARGEPGSARRPVDTVAELAAAAGSGAEALDETVTGQLWFRRDWLDARAIDPAQCVVIGVRGESMEPTLPDGCSILVDRSRTRRLSGHVYVLHTDEGIVVKRLVHGADGWLLASDHPAWKDRDWPDESEVIGEVRWMARGL